MNLSKDTIRQLLARASARDCTLAARGLHTLSACAMHEGGSKVQPTAKRLFDFSRVLADCANVAEDLAAEKAGCTEETTE